MNHVTLAIRSLLPKDISNETNDLILSLNGMSAVVFKSNGKCIALIICM